MGKKAEPAPTLKDVASAAGLSVAAVSKVFNNREGVSAANRALVTRIAAELGYKGISGRGATSRPVQSAVVVTMDRYVSNDAFYGQIIDSLLEFSRAEHIDIDLTIVTPNDLQSKDFDWLHQTSGDGVFLVGIDNQPVIDAVRALNRPAILVNGMDSQMTLSSVSPDNYFAGRFVTRRLLELGHTEIVHVTHLYRESLVRRMMGFREAMESAGAWISEGHHIFDVGSPQMLSLSCNEFVAHSLETRKVKPTAVICANDMVALGVMRAASSLGLDVPTDISVIGFDGLAVGAHASPPLSTLEIDGREMAYHAVQMLLDQARQNFSCARRLSLGVRYVERSTVAAPSSQIASPEHRAF